MFNNSKKAHDLQHELNILKSEHKQELEDRTKWYNARINAAAAHYNDLQEDHSRTLVRLDEVRNKLVGAGELEAKLQVLNDKQRIFDAKDKRFGEIAKEIAEMYKKVEAARDEGYKKGYPDGLADGLRKGTEMTADDRRMMAQIAALSAASHSSDASKEVGKAVGEAIKKTMTALGDGK